MTGPSTDPGTEISTRVDRLRHEGRYDKAFLDQYTKLLNTLAELGEVECTHKGGNYQFSYLGKALSINVDMLAHRDNHSQDGSVALRQGAWAVEHLVTLAEQVKAAPGDAQKAWVLREILIELAHPFTTTQDRKNTCAAEAISTQLMIDNPAEWTRLAIDLLTKPSGADIRTSSASGSCLRTPMDIWKYDDGAPERSPIARALQAAVKNSFAPDGWQYSNKEDKYKDAEGKEHEPGMLLEDAKAALEALLGREHILRKKESLSTNWFKKVPELGVYTVLAWNSKGKSHEYHAVNVIGYDAKRDRVIFRNPHRQQDWPKDNDIEDPEGPPRRSEDKETGLESMTLKEFLKRVQYCLPSREALEIIEGAAKEKEDGEKDAQNSSNVDDELSNDNLESSSFGPSGKKAGIFQTAAFYSLVILGTATAVGVPYVGWRYLESNRKPVPAEPVVDPAVVGDDPGDSTARDGSVERGGVANSRPTNKPEQHPLTEDKARESLPHQFLGVREWKALFGEEPTPARGFPMALTQELLSKPCPIAENGNSISASHQAILVPGQLSLKKLEALCERNGIQLVISDYQLRQDPALTEAAPVSYWAMTVEPQAANSPFAKVCDGKSDARQVSMLRSEFPEHKLNSVREAVISILLARSNTSDPCPNTSMICAEVDRTGRQLAVRYDARKKEIVIGTTAEFPFATMSVGFDLKKAAQ